MGAGARECCSRAPGRGTPSDARLRLAAGDRVLGRRGFLVGLKATPTGERYQPASPSGEPGVSVAVVLGAPESIENATVLVAPTLPAASRARESIVWAPCALTVSTEEYACQSPPSRRYWRAPRPEPPSASAPASVTFTAPVYVPPSPGCAGSSVAAAVGAVLSSLTVSVFSALTLPAASLER